jgi:hypothetical protein
MNVASNLVVRDQPTPRSEAGGILCKANDLRTRLLHLDVGLLVPPSGYRKTDLTAQKRDYYADKKEKH